MMLVGPNVMLSGIRMKTISRPKLKLDLESEHRGLKFGGTRLANGYSFANAKDPDKNSVSISSRAYRSVSELDGQ